MRTNIASQTAIVTGGAKGFGAGITSALRSRCMNVWITGRDEAALKDAAKCTGAKYIRADVTSSADWDNVIATVLEDSGRLDVLINNAGAGIRLGNLSDMLDNEPAIRECIEVNLLGTIFGCARAVKAMQEQKPRGGLIINMSSVCQRKGWSRFPVYSAAKAGVGQLSNCLYTSMREYGIRVTTLMPSLGNTEFFKKTNIPDLANKYSPSDFLQPEDIGEIVAFLCEQPPHVEIQDMTIWPIAQELDAF
jgi:NADP-dependent 3-hydroxy acid dehydrogenase YdfG